MKRFLLLLAVTLGLAAATRADEVVFITHSKSAADSLSADDAKAILVGAKTKWDAGGVIKLAVQTSGPAHEHVVQTYAQRSPDQFDKHWKKLVFTSKGVMPFQASGDVAMIDYVAKTPGALGYVSAASVPGTVKILPIK